MKQRWLIAVFILLLAVVGGMLFWGRQAPEPKQARKVARQTTMKLESPAFGHNQAITVKYTFDGENMNPPLVFSGVPKGAQSLVLVVDDPDAPRGTWVHWTVWNIAPDTKEIRENETPEMAVEGFTSFGKPRWGGPCPPSGTHRYFFKLYALDMMLDLPADTDKNDLEAAMVSHVLASSELIGLYSRGRSK